MTALTPEYLEILRRELQSQYVAHLPPLLLGTNAGAQPAGKDISRALSAFAMHSLWSLTARMAARSVVDDFGDNGIDAIYYEEKTETLHLLQSKLQPSEFKQADAQAFCAGIRLLIQQDFAAFNSNVRQRQIQLESALSQASIIKLWVVYTGVGVTGTAKTTLAQFIADESLGETDRLSPDIGYFGPADIAAELRTRQSYKPVNTEIFLANDVKLTDPRVTWYGQVSVADLVGLHRDQGKALYEKNVRYFLGTSKSEVNQQIQQTLKADPAAFFYLNNGVTALCTRVTAKERTAGRRRLKVNGLSIINGAQTVASAAELMSRPSPPIIDKARVMLTLIQVAADGTFGPRVTRARNSQNPVAIASFVSQDPTQERLRQELSALGVVYHYRPEAEAVPSAQSILLAEAVVALGWLSPDPRVPVWLKSGKGDLYETESTSYKALFSDALFGSHLANAVFFLREIQKLIKRADLSTQKQQERLGYRHGAHAIGAVFLKQLVGRIRAPAIVALADIPNIISTSFDVHRQHAADLFPKVAGPLSFFKSTTETTPYLSELMEVSYGLKAHVALPALRSAAHTGIFPQEPLFNFLAQQAPQI